MAEKPAPKDLSSVPKESVKVVFVNPFEVGITYKQFLNAIPKGVTVEAYCKGQLTNEQILWLVGELQSLESLNK
jgi:hypothetical protein